MKLLVLNALPSLISLGTFFVCWWYRKIIEHYKLSAVAFWPYDPFWKTTTNPATYLRHDRIGMVGLSIGLVVSWHLLIAVDYISSIGVDDANESQTLSIVADCVLVCYFFAQAKGFITHLLGPLLLREIVRLDSDDEETIASTSIVGENLARTQVAMRTSSFDDDLQARLNTLRMSVSEPSRDDYRNDVRQTAERIYQALSPEILSTIYPPVVSKQ